MNSRSLRRETSFENSFTSFVKSLTSFVRMRVASVAFGFLVGMRVLVMHVVYYERGPLYNFIMKITTKTGDKGETGLFGGRRVSKASRIIEMLGELDELQAVVGWCGVGRRGILTLIEDDLYRMMSIVGFEFKCPKNIKAIGEADVRRLEKEIKKYETLAGGELHRPAAGLLKKFVRPGKSEISARLHIARTVCRRAERGMAGMVEGLGCEMKSIPGNGSSHKQQTGQAGAVFVLKYLNRLSDLLFVMACVG